MTIKVTETRALHGRTFIAGTKYKVVNRDATAEDEVHAHHAEQLVRLGAAENLTAKKAARNRQASAKQARGSPGRPASRTVASSKAAEEPSSSAKGRQESGGET